MGSDDGWDGQAELQALRAQVEALEAQNETFRAFVRACTCGEDNDDLGEAIRRAEGAEAEVTTLNSQYEEERLARLKAEARCRELEEVLGRVEWVGTDGWEVCPWCGRESGEGHSPDCPRQRVLAAPEPPGSPQDRRCAPDPSQSSPGAPDAGKVP